jgi:peptidoglycan/xylan/chitin deacetylase (PgdA/CDA1 family)
MHSFFLTFDVEDFISENSIPGLHCILEHLKKHDLHGLFFITGNFAEKLSNFPVTVDLLKEHQIGFHSSGHSIHPAIFEFTDVESYSEAYQTSLSREVAHINPLTGTIEGSGGIKALRSVFPKKQIVAFRAPGYCWSPPHLEALRTLGITYDFSTNLSVEPASFQGITFFPFTIFLTNWQGGIRSHQRLQRITLQRKISVLTIHPSTMVNQGDWDLIYYPNYNKSGLNPENLVQPSSRSPFEVTSMFRKFNLLLRHLKTLQRVRLLEVTPALKIANRPLNPMSVDVTRCYETSIKWAEGFGYKPVFLHNHFARFFKMDRIRFQQQDHTQ